MQPPAPTARLEDSERIYFQHVLGVAEELLMLLPERVKRKYELVKETLAVRLDDSIRQEEHANGRYEGLHLLRRLIHSSSCKFANAISQNIVESKPNF
jgi:hypothetical protein